MIWELFAKWPGLAASVAAAVLGAFLIVLGMLFVMWRVLTGFSPVQLPWAVVMMAVGVALMTIVALVSRSPPRSEGVPKSEAG